ncbi:MAG: hypothetical protein ACFFD4_29905 [Candidatus Odinarchaeota archaeon]
MLQLVTDDTQRFPDGLPLFGVNYHCTSPVLSLKMITALEYFCFPALDYYSSTNGTVSALLSRTPTTLRYASQGAFWRRKVKQ